MEEQGYLHVDIGLNGKKIAGMPREFGQIRYDTRDNKFHVTYQGYKWDKKMEELIDRHNNKPTKEHNAFMDIEQRYRLSK